MSSDFYKLILFVVIVHAILLTIDYLLQNLISSHYLSFRKRNCIVVQPFKLSWFTTAFNHYIRKLGRWCPAFQKIWFSLGMWITIPLFPLALYFLIQSVYVLFMVSVLKENKSKSVGTPFLEPAVPGVNIPLSDAGYYLLALMMCSIFHELGHAVASVREGAHINGVGLFLLLMVPVVYVRMEGLEKLSYDKQLRVLCAGIWHNFILVGIASLLLFSLPWLCQPFYQVGNGVQITSVQKESPLGKSGGLKVGDIIFLINDCRVFNRDSWIKCLHRVAVQPITGYCISSEFVRVNDESITATRSNDVVDCCGNETISKICFEYLKTKENDVNLPEYSCLRARSVIQEHEKTCYSSDDCANQYCFRPSLANGTKLTEVHRKNCSEVLFLGHPVEILRDVGVSEFVKSWYLPVSFPNGVHKFCTFLIMFSGALASLNLMPCFHLDGQYIIRILVDVCLAKCIGLQSVRLIISSLIAVVCSSILVTYTILILFSMFAS